VLSLDFPFHVFGMFECLLIKVGVGEFVEELIFVAPLFDLTMAWLYYLIVAQLHLDKWVMLKLD